MCELLTNVLYSLSRTALGRPSLTAALVERCYDERRGLFQPLVRPEVSAHIPVTWTALAPLALPDLPEEIGRRLVEQHLLDPARFWLPTGVPSVAADEPSFQPDDRGRFVRRRYWRGPVWINAVWLIWLGLVRLGYDDHARELARRISASVRGAGLREYYEPYDGSGMGQTDFAWSTLVLEMLGDP
jgi:glycogen debranching enzyme